LRAFRNLVDGDLQVPAGGIALVGQNGHGKTNLLEAIYYPVLFRSFRGAADNEIVAQGQQEFGLALTVLEGTIGQVDVRFAAPGRQKRVRIDGTDEVRPTSALGRWLAVVFQPGDVGLAGGPATERRRYLDRMLSLADADYLRALLRYRAALAQRNAALRQRQADVAHAFEDILAATGACIVERRLRWVSGEGAEFPGEVAGLGERSGAGLAYGGNAELADAGAWREALASSAARDRARGSTSVGPHRHDLELVVEGRSLRTYGSTGQLRSAAIALKLLELETLRRARGEEPVLLLDDVFAELDATRQDLLARRLAMAEGRQVFVTAPRRDELPQAFDLPRWRMDSGQATPEGRG
jgi:DNA replication and repair protein RecF